ncbi:class I SAM-dependent RNA methyltransferase [Plastorhodobacter daqingensis]|uniref:Class I SAM-dependent RNA methyltransferase n=1 Tax=Plastorhodobacter daqingensis TaxID=1387281 RepID=A0ABW2UGS4_9RHOB
MSEEFEIYLVATPGLETVLAREAAEKGFAAPQPSLGGVTIRGGWPDVWRANLELRGAARILARLGSFRAMHLAQLDKRARKFPWATFFKPGQAVQVEASCHASRIYHDRAAAQRIATALHEELGAEVRDDAQLRVLARIDDDLCTISVDTSGELLHRRGHKEAVNRAPMRETLAALFLRECGFTGDEPVLDPMCGSGTFVIEAAEIATGLQAGRSRSFAFEELLTFDPAAYTRLRQAQPIADPTVRFLGSDRDPGAIRMSQGNAERAGVSAITAFRNLSVADLERPEGPAGLVIVNPPYGGRIGNKKLLLALHGQLGDVLRERFKGWRVGLVTSEPGLAKATRLPFGPPGPYVAHGGLKIRLYKTQPLR